jgi:phosphoribosylformylglycinamidine synthase
VVAGTLAPLDLGIEHRVQRAVQTAVSGGLVSMAHDCSDGGIAIALAEACVTGHEPIGCDVTLGPSPRPDLTLFGEGPSRVIVSVAPDQAREFEALMAESAIPWRWIGRTGGGALTIRVGDTGVIDLDVARIREAWRNGFVRHMA